MQRRFSDQETQRSSPDASHESLSEPSESEPISPVGAERSPSPAESQYISFASTPLNGNSTAIRPEQVGARSFCLADNVARFNLPLPPPLPPLLLSFT